MAVDPYGRRQSGDTRKHLVPQNPRLWAMIQNLARQKFEKIPSLPASKWMHEEYVKRGGTFVESRKQDTRHKRGKETKEGKKEREQEEKGKRLTGRRKRLKGDKE